MSSLSESSAPGSGPLPEPAETSAGQPSGRHWRWLPWLVLALLGAAGGLAWWMAARTDREMRQDLLQQASLVAQSANVDRIKALAGAESDLGNPAYQVVKAQFSALKRANPGCRFIYLMGRKPDGTVLFFLDSEPADSPDCSPPGQVYAEAPEQARRAFFASGGTTAGPYTDRWGTWVSAFAPVREAGADSTLAVLGLDIDARQWHAALVRAALPPVLLGLALAAVLLAWAWARTRLRRGAGPRGFLGRNLDPLLIATLGLTLTLSAAWMIQAREIRARAAAFDQVAAGRLEAVTRTLHALRDVELEGLGRFLEGRTATTPDAFRDFTGFLDRNQSIQAWEMISVVPAADQARFEARMRAQGQAGFRIWEKDGQGRPVPAAGREVYYPVTLVTPLEGNRQALGFDLGSEPVRRAALEASVRTGFMTATEPVTLVQERSTQAGMLVYRPAFSADAGRRPRLFALAVLRMGSLLQNVHSDAAMPLGLTLLGGDGQQRLLASTRGPDDPVSPRLSLSRPVFAFGKAFSVTAYADRQFLRQWPLRAGWITLLVGSLLTTALALVVQMTSRRREVLEGLVAERTRALQESETLQRTLLTNLPVGVTIVDPVSRVIEQVNDHAAGLFGAPVGQLLGRRCHAFLCPAQEGACPVCDLHQEVDKSERAMLRWDGSRVPILKTVKRVRLGGQEKLLECFLDISERKRAEQAMASATERLSLATRVSGVGVWDLDLVRKRAVVDEQMNRLYGIAPGAEVDSFADWQSSVHPEDAPRMEEAHRLALAGERELDTEFRILWPDGSVHNIRAIASVRRDASGCPVRMIGTNWDITGQKQLEDQLRASRDEAFAAVRARSQFLANMSHEIRTPMNGLLGMAELLAATELTPEQRDYVETINRSGDGLLSLLNDILDFSKMEAGQLVLERVSFSLEHLVYDIAELFRARVEGKPIELLVDFDPANPRQVVGDPGRLRQILCNLVSNAVKFTQQGYVLLGVRSAVIEGERVQLAVSVQDTGIGIPADKQGLLFQPFTQADATTARRFGGTGLGLTIVKRLAEAMGGRVWLQSAEGSGTTFTVELELGLEREAAPAVQDRVALAGARILLVDDLPINLRLLSRQLRPQGAVLREAATGAEALALIRDALDRGEPFDAAVVDLHLGDAMSGEELGRAVRADARCRALALLSLTAGGVRGDAARLAELGFNAYLVKPLRAELLVRAIGLAMEHVRGPEAAPLVTRHSCADAGPGPSAQARTIQARVLLVEDQEVNQLVARKFLERAGATVTVAGDGFKALELLARESFDLALMDCQMPGLDGFEATARIRRQEQGAGGHLPIIAMTANALAGDRDRCLQAGMDDYLTKPIRRDTLLQAVARWLPARRGSGPQAPAPAPPDAGAGVELDPTMFENLLDIFGHDQAKLGEELLAPFISLGRERLDDLSRSIRAGDGQGVKSVAHALKGSSLTLGLGALGRAAKQLELGALESTQDELLRMLEETQDAFAAARGFLERLMA